MQSFESAVSYPLHHAQHRCLIAYAGERSEVGFFRAAAPRRTKYNCSIIQVIYRLQMRCYSSSIRSSPCTESDQESAKSVYRGPKCRAQQVVGIKGTYCCTIYCLYYCSRALLVLLYNEAREPDSSPCNVQVHTSLVVATADEAWINKKKHGGRRCALCSFFFFFRGGFSSASTALFTRKSAGVMKCSSAYHGYCCEGLSAIAWAPHQSLRLPLSAVEAGLHPLPRARPLVV